MKCPKCHGLLELNDAENHVGYTCPHCKGIWLPPSYLDSLKYMHGFNLVTFKSALASGKIQSPSVLACPSCSHTLSTSRTKNINLDWCERCGGTWFDHRELMAIAPLNYAQSGHAAGEPAGLAITVIDKLIAAYLEKFPEPPPISEPDKDGYIPNHIPLKDRLRNSVFSALLFTYGSVGLYFNDIFIPSKQGGVHLHNLAAWTIYGAFACACLVMISIVVDHYDKRNNELSYRTFERYTQTIGWILFAISFVLLIANK